MDFTRKLSFLVFVLCVLISLKNQKAETNRKGSSSFRSDDDYSQRVLQEDDARDYAADQQQLRYDYYSETCPFAEQMIRSTVQKLYELRPDVAPALLRLVFHDCFVGGCDASVLLDPTGDIESEKRASPNESLKGYDFIDIIKSELEEACPGVVSCADIVALAARDSVLLAGGPFYPLYTGRKDSVDSYYEEAYELPSPQDNLSKTLATFASRGFDEREIVSLLGAHSTGTIHCNFFLDRLFNFTGTEPDPSINTEFLDILRSKCNPSHPSPSPSPSPSSPSNALLNNLGMRMDYEGPRTNFGMLYYRSLLQGKGLLFVDQQLTAGEETETWVRAYASDAMLFQRDFGLAMIKLSNHQIKTGSNSEVRYNCRKVN